MSVRHLALFGLLVACGTVIEPEAGPGTAPSMPASATASTAPKAVSTLTQEEILQLAMGVENGRSCSEWLAGNRLLLHAVGTVALRNEQLATTTAQNRARDLAKAAMDTYVAAMLRLYYQANPLPPPDACCSIVRTPTNVASPDDPEVWFNDGVAVAHIVGDADWFLANGKQVKADVWRMMQTGDEPLAFEVAHRAQILALGRLPPADMEDRHWLAPCAPEREPPLPAAPKLPR